MGAEGVAARAARAAAVRKHLIIAKFEGRTQCRDDLDPLESSGPRVYCILLGDPPPSPKRSRPNASTTSPVHSLEISLQRQAHQLSVGYQSPPDLCHHPCAKSVGARQPRLFSGRNWTIRICRLKSKKKQSTLSTLRGYSTVPITELALEKTARSSTCFGTFQ